MQTTEGLLLLYRENARIFEKKDEIFCRLCYNDKRKSERKTEFPSQTC